MKNSSNSSGMPPSSATDLITSRLSLSFVLAIVFWTMVIAALAGWHYYQSYQAAVANATTAARHSHSKDLAFRNWSLLHSGVYVPVTAETPPNPYLAHIPERDLRTSTGQLLTLINPSYMTRIVHDMGDPIYGTLGHITSRLPVRLENAPDDWEASALHNFEKGVTEQSSLEPIGSATYLRLMRPLMVETVCLKC
ncbi:MAG: DUF3365 domain-containing protein, partial [Desulfuromonadales bacterium]|nr:DUF3365 domain-containing protein [Desulfuromonadales bacterium]